jgi:hypothetical protein
MKKVLLTKGKIALIDDEDWEVVSQHKWCAQHAGKGYFYAYSRSGSKGLKMHRFIMDAKPGEEVDHINGDTLDNRRKNLRICSRKNNQQNRYKAWGTSQYKGVSWYKRHSKWVAKIHQEGKPTHLGYFDSEIEAAQAYDTKAKELFGEFANINLRNMGKNGESKRKNGS